MVKLTESRVQTILHSFKNKKVLVLGDLMLDRYLTGQVSRLSPEAPVPVVDIENEYSRLGGAANVGNNIMALGGTPLLIGIVGDDHSGQELKNIMSKQGFVTDGILTDPGRPTTVKTRVIANNQHVVRTDKEVKTDINSEISTSLKEVFSLFLNEVDAVIIQDYNKGLITKELIEYGVSAANDLNKIVTVDPKFDHFFDFLNVTVFKPNRGEAEEALGKKIKTEEQVIEAAHILFDRLNCLCLMITLGEQGMAIFNQNREVQFIPTRARKVHDVSGAGDTVISSVTLSLSAGASFEESAILANYAAGIVCSEVGIVPITAEILKKGIFSS